MSECRIRVMKRGQHFVTETLQLVRGFRGIEEIDRTTRVVALAMAQNTRFSHLVVFGTQAGECLLNRLNLCAQSVALQLVARGNAVDQMPVAGLPDSGAKGLNGVGDGLLEISQIAFLMNRRVKGRAIKHPREQSESLVVIGRLN